MQLQPYWGRGDFHSCSGHLLSTLLAGSCFDGTRGAAGIVLTGLRTGRASVRRVHSSYSGVRARHSFVKASASLGRKCTLERLTANKSSSARGGRKTVSTQMSMGEGRKADILSGREARIAVTRPVGLQFGSETQD